MTVLVATLGSLGDLHPFLAVARALRERGEDVLFLGQEPHGDEVRGQGLRFQPIISSHDHQRTMRHPDLWHPIRGFGVLWRHLAVPAIGPTLDAIRNAHAAEGATLSVFASPLVVGARLARERWPFHLVTGHTAPAALRSCRDPMFVGRHRAPTWLPQAFRRQIWRQLDERKLEPMAGPAISKWRQELGLPPLREPVFDKWLHSPDQVLGMFPNWFGPMQTDWPVPIQAMGFPLYERDFHPSDAEGDLRRFMDQHTASPLVIFYPGSTATDHAPVMRAAAVSLAALNIRSIVIDADTTSGQMSEYSYQLVRARLPQLLSAANLFVHHGGIGAIAQGLAAGVRQLLVPAAYDQFDNASRLQGLQGGFTVTTPKNLLRHIQAVIGADRPEQRFALQYSLPSAPNVATIAICDAINRKRPAKSS